MTMVNELDVGLDRDTFMRSLIRELAGALEDVVGLEEADGYISLVGQAIGEQINTAYTKALQVDQLSAAQVGQVMVNLKHRIQGEFFIIEETPEKIVLGNTACPFGDKVAGRQSMCMMTSNVFGLIAARNLGYAKVELQQTIARGDAGCRVVVYLQPTEDSRGAEGREYYGDLAPSTTLPDTR